MFIWILIGLFCLSFLLSLISLWRDLKKNIKTEHVVEELSKGRVIFHAPSASHVDVPIDDALSEKEQPTLPTQGPPEMTQIKPTDHILDKDHAVITAETDNENNSSTSFPQESPIIPTDIISHEAYSPLATKEHIEQTKLSEKEEVSQKISEN